MTNIIILQDQRDSLTAKKAEESKSQQKQVLSEWVS